MTVQISPSLLSADFARLGEQVESAAAGGADLLHFDVMDGHFVPNITFGAQVLSAVRDRAEIPFSVHLMIENPQDYVKDFARAGADIIIVHAEATVHLQRLLAQIRELGKLAGVALNPATPLSAVEWVLGDIDYLLLMTVNPGFGGQQFLPVSLNKIAAARAMLDGRGLSTLLEVDGGINEETIGPVARAGARVAVAGTAVFKSPLGVAGSIKGLREAAQTEKVRS